MAKKKNKIRGLGSRYGVRLRKKLSSLFIISKIKHKCPYCMKNKVKRISAGVWYCKGCSVKFAGKAYTPR